MLSSATRDSRILSRASSDAQLHHFLCTCGVDAHCRGKVTVCHSQSAVHGKEEGVGGEGKEVLLIPCARLSVWLRLPSLVFMTLYDSQFNI